MQASCLAYWQDVLCQFVSRDVAETVMFEAVHPIPNHDSIVFKEMVEAGLAYPCSDAKRVIKVAEKCAQKFRKETRKKLRKKNPQQLVSMIGSSGSISGPHMGNHCSV